MNVKLYMTFLGLNYNLVLKLALHFRQMIKRTTQFTSIKGQFHFVTHLDCTKMQRAILFCYAPRLHKNAQTKTILLETDYETTTKVSLRHDNALFYYAIIL